MSRYVFSHSCMFSNVPGILSKVSFHCFLPGLGWVRQGLHDSGIVFFKCLAYISDDNIHSCWRINCLFCIGILWNAKIIILIVIRWFVQRLYLQCFSRTVRWVFTQIEDRTRTIKSPYIRLSCKKQNFLKPSTKTLKGVCWIGHYIEQSESSSSTDFSMSFLRRHSLR